ncbi:MAG: metallo-mystery pair system four-Cys motif protein [Gammaproteobacteria bacterium]|nr:metallo-mystery pair system four-Cys motif protein [Gammaproteobacteria bacterium]MDH5344526.1 metallo-mystery pair system four-Cys motif protein [Gammaproteobacteria bacterium]
MRLRLAGIVFCVLGIAACTESSAPVSIPFEAAYAGAPIDCAEKANVRMTDLRFYVSNPRIRDGDGNWHEVALDDDDAWQQTHLALIDLEDGGGSCTNGTADLYTTLSGTARGRSWRGLEFTLGVPFEVNHGDPLAAEPPLGDAAMHWHWRGGYKFLRAGLRTADDGFWLHLGSTGCRGTIGNITYCDAPNRVTVRLDDFGPGDAVVVDLAELVAGGALEDRIAADCSSGPGEAHCPAAFRALGLDHATGAADGVQKLFRSRARP